jgi:CheY-like chemotaxis protein
MGATGGLDRGSAPDDPHAVERALLHAQRLESLGRLASGVAHDFNNVLTIVGGYAEMLRDDPSLAPGLEPMVDAILQATRRGGQITKQLLVLSRRSAPMPELVEVDEFVRTEARLLARIIGDHLDLQLRLGCPGQFVHLDPGHLSQIVLNLAVNARDAMPVAGTLRIATQHQGDSVAITVADDGIGIAPEIAERIFQPFFTTKGQGHGTGLGLATVKTLVELSGGRISVVSSPGEGSVFTVVLPIAQAVGRPGGGEPEPPVPGGDETIMVVEDELDLLSFVRQHLQSLGYRVIATLHPHDALRIASTDVDIDLVVADIALPSMDGRTLVEALRFDRPELRALYVSGFTGTELDGAVDTGSRSFLAKPFSPAALAHRIRELLDA